MNITWLNRADLDGLACTNFFIENIKEINDTKLNVYYEKEQFLNGIDAKLPSILILDINPVSNYSDNVKFIDKIIHLPILKETIIFLGMYAHTEYLTKTKLDKRYFDIMTTHNEAIKISNSILDLISPDYIKRKLQTTVEKLRTSNIIEVLNY